jgi:hypothetical protein
MRSKFILILAATFLVFAITQCTKKKSDTPMEEEPAATTASGPNTVADIIAANGSAPNTVTVDATVATTLTINGNIFEIPANAFVTAGGGTVAGTVTLTVKTVMTKSQIIFSGAGANSSSSKLVVTKGCIKSTASQNSQSLRLNGSGGFFINVPDPSSATPPPMKKYYAPKITATDSTAYWALGTDVADITQRTFTSSATVYHQASLDSLKWLNVGVQYDSVSAPKTAVTVTLNPAQFTKANTMVFLSFNGSLTVGALFEITPGTFRISNMPIGKGVHIIAVAALNGHYYADKLSTLVSSTPVGLNMQMVTQSQMQAIVASLP